MAGADGRRRGFDAERGLARGLQIRHEGDCRPPPPRRSAARWRAARRNGFGSALASRESWVEVFRQALGQRDQKLGEVLADPAEGKPKLNVTDHFDLRVRRHRLYLAAQ